jgi:hypothetical protein
MLDNFDENAVALKQLAILSMGKKVGDSPKISAQAKEM